MHGAVVNSCIAENTRAAYPIEYIPNAKIPCVGPHPKNVILLACDAFGVLPPVSKLNLAQTMYHFISGYTALVAGTEDGIKEPQATFSACFGAAFIMLHPTKYAAMLAEKMQKYGATGWLVNTGWSGGRYARGTTVTVWFASGSCTQLVFGMGNRRFHCGTVACLSGTAWARGSGFPTPERSSTPSTPASFSPPTTRRPRSLAWRSRLRSRACRRKSSTQSTPYACSDTNQLASLLFISQSS